MAFVVVTHIGGVLRCARFMLFQAKLLQPDGNLRIDIRQLNTLLRSNTHASQYIYWNENRSPVVIPALVLDTHLLERFRDTLKRSGERSVQVEHLLPFSWDFSSYFAWNMLGLWSGAEFHDSTAKPPAFGGPFQPDDGDGGPPPELVQILHKQNVPRVIVAYQGISTAVRNPLVDVMSPGPEQIPQQRRRPRI